MDFHPYSHETSIFTLGSPHEDVQGGQTKLHPGFTMGKLVQPSPGISIHSTKPDIIIGTETWLNSNINSIEIFKPDWGYTVYRKDRPNQSYGGVLIAVSNNLISSEATELDTTCEILWVYINLIGCKSLHFGAFYRPPQNDLDPLFQLDAFLSRITHTTNGYVWIAK